MTAEQARLALQRANTLVRRAVENALEMKAAATEIPASLQRVAEALNSVRHTGTEDLRTLTPELDALRSRVRHLQTLLDSASSFYCASIACSASQSSTGYGPGAKCNVQPEAPRFQLKA